MSGDVRSRPATRLAQCIIGATLFAPPIAISQGLPLLRLEILLAAVVLLHSPVKIAGLKRVPGGRALLWSVGLFALSGLVVCFLGVVSGSSIGSHVGTIVLWPLCQVLLALTALALARRGANVRTIAGTLWLGVTLLSVIGWAQLYNVASVNEWFSPLYLGYESRLKHLVAIERGRAYGTMGNANAFGALLALTVAMAVVSSLAARGRLRGRDYALAATGLISVLTTLSRSALIFAVVVGFLLLLQGWGGTQNADRPARMLSGLARPACVLALGVVLTQAALGHLATIPNSIAAERLGAEGIFGSDTTLSRRTVKWNDATEGKNAIGILAGWYGRSTDHRGLDSEPLRVMLMGGLIAVGGLASYWWSIMSMARVLGRSRWILYGTVVGAVMFSSTAFFVLAYQLPALLTFVLALIVRAGALGREWNRRRLSLGSRT